MDVGTPAVGQRDGAQLRIHQGKRGIHSEGAGRGSADGKLLRGNIRVEGFWLNRPPRIPAEDRPGHQTSPGGGVEAEEPVRYRGPSDLQVGDSGQADRAGFLRNWTLRSQGLVRKLRRESLGAPGGGLPRAAAGGPGGEAVGAVQGDETHVPTGCAVKSAWAPLGPESVALSLSSSRCLGLPGASFPSVLLVSSPTSSSIYYFTAGRR